MTWLWRWLHDLRRHPPKPEWESPDDRPVDVWSFRGRERLAVHEARTEADVWSRAGRPVRRED